MAARLARCLHTVLRCVEACGLSTLDRPQVSSCPRKPVAKAVCDMTAKSISFRSKPSSNLQQAHLASYPNRSPALIRDGDDVDL
ncbi:uncharacterized protein B0H64DRAFT_394765 [Chaetomium fimeti]|uniref:Uncharacterized protein n=1 Tax=Chaetomium fimeti TaxID=1854472 RepID=A0AAE0HEW9_9PEZI|nr:hypothetical protein B0H64DRAFT_394765 [Chaetomium fimeti]